MRRSILTVMIDVMVLSVLSMTAGKRGSGDQAGPVPLYRMPTIVQEGLRKEQDFQNQVEMLKTQLAEATEVAKIAIEQVNKSEVSAEKVREQNLEIQEKLLAAQTDAMRMQLQAEKSDIEMELAASRAAESQLKAMQMEELARKMEQREAEAKTRSDEALAKAQIAESAVLEAERRVMASVAEQKDLQVKLAETEKIKLEYEEAQARLKTLENQVQQQRLEIAKAQAKEEEARRVQTELLVRNEERVEEHAAKTAELQKQVVTLEVQKDNESQKVAKLEEEKRLSEEEAAKSVWVKRDEALRNMNIQYTEYSSSGDRDYTTDKTLTMPLVKIGDLVFVPAEFEKLGLKSSFFGGGLSDYVTDVKGELRSSKDEEIGWSKITSILVSGKEPQVCLVRFAGNSTGAISAISMDELKEQRIRSALLFTPDEITEYSNVQIMPIVGTDYLKIIAPDGKKPKVGDYLLSERGDFIGVMVTKENAYVIANSLQGIPAPISIPMVRGKDSDGYFNEFIKMLAIARERVKIQMGIRNL